MKTGISMASSKPIGNLGGLDLTYSADVQYFTGALCVDRGGLWQWVPARPGNSRPISGNADWTLVGGTAYVERLMSPADILSMDQTSVQVEFVPSPGIGKALVFQYLTSQVFPGGTPATGNQAVAKYTGDNQELCFGVYLASDNDASAAFSINYPFFSETSGPQGYFAAGVTEDTSLSINIAGGSDQNPLANDSALVRLGYTIVNVAQTTFFFSISAVNQGTKTLTVSPDPTTAIAAGDTITIVGNTGSLNGTYTIASRDATSVTTVEALPDDTADGWVKKA